MMGDSGVLPFDLWKLIHQRNFIQQPSFFQKVITRGNRPYRRITVLRHGMGVVDPLFRL